MMQMVTRTHRCSDYYCYYYHRDSVLVATEFKLVAIVVILQHNWAITMIKTFSVTTQIALYYHLHPRQYCRNSLHVMSFVESNSL